MADKKHDEVANYIAWACFCAEFHDGHVSFTVAEEEVAQKAMALAGGNDYGLSFMTLENGSTVAVNVEESDFFRDAGIWNGTVITSWDGRDISQVAKESLLYQPEGEHYFQGENIWEGPITILVNQNSASAADHLTKVMQGMENVTVMGFTEPNGSGQGLNGIHLQSGDLGFSSALMLEKDGSIYIDSGVDRESGNDIDVRIPFDEEAVQVLFEEGGDYVLQKCMEFYE